LTLISEYSGWIEAFMGGLPRQAGQKGRAVYRCPGSGTRALSGRRSAADPRQPFYPQFLWITLWTRTPAESFSRVIYTFLRFCSKNERLIFPNIFNNLRFYSCNKSEKNA
jgi:hypothetical protein